MVLPAASPPVFLSLAGHPLRWRLLRELASSDRRVRELCERTQAAQSLVSYHLRRLRAAGLVASRRSSADARDSYYALCVAHCGQLLGDAGTALHPALKLTRAPALTGPTNRVRMLFMCTGNSARSQIAEALAVELGKGSIEARSAGSHPKPLHANAVRVMNEYGIDIAAHGSKHFDRFSSEQFDLVVTLCDRVRERCPEFPGHPNLVHWSIADPAASGSTDSETYPAFQRTAAEIHERLGFLIESLAMSGHAEEVAA